MKSFIEGWNLKDTKCCSIMKHLAWFFRELNLSYKSLYDNVLWFIILARQINYSEEGKQILFTAVFGLAYDWHCNKHSWQERTISPWWPSPLSFPTFLPSLSSITHPLTNTPWNLSQVSDNGRPSILISHLIKRRYSISIIASVFSTLFSHLSLLFFRFISTI